MLLEPTVFHVSASRGEENIWIIHSWPKCQLKKECFSWWGCPYLITQRWHFWLVLRHHFHLANAGQVCESTITAQLSWWEQSSAWKKCMAERRQPHACPCSPELLEDAACWGRPMHSLGLPKSRKRNSGGKNGKLSLKNVFILSYAWFIYWQEGWIQSTW